MIENKTIKNLSVALVDVDDDIDKVKHIRRRGFERISGRCSLEEWLIEVDSDTATMHAGMALVIRPALLEALVSIIGYAEGE